MKYRTRERIMPVYHRDRISPDLARTREFQANLRGQRAFLQLVDDAACLTEEDKKKLLQEFAEEKVNESN